MGHEPHIGLVDAHSERDRRHHDEAVLLQETVLVFRARGAVHSGVIGEGRDALFTKKGGQVLGLPSRAAINNAAFAFVPGDKVQELTASIAFCAHGETQVRSVETVNEDLRRAGEETAENILARGRVGRRGERQNLNA